MGLPEPIRLRGSHNLFFTAFEALRLDIDRPVIALGSMNSYIAEYAYQIMLSEDGSQELLSFHAARPATSSAVAHSPHLHVGSKLGAGIAEVGIMDFHKRHIPTGVVPFSSVIRFLIEELGVEPIRANWDEILANVLD